MTRKALCEPVRFYIRNCLIGFFWAAVFVGTLLWWDVAGLWGLVRGSDVGLMAGLMLFFFNGIVFAGAQCSVAILLMTEPDDPPSGGGHGAAQPVSSPVPVTIR